MALDAALVLLILSRSRKVSRKWPPSGCGLRSSSSITSAAERSAIGRSRPILALPYLRKNLPGRLASQADRLRQLRKVGTQERVCCLLLSKRRGNGGFALPPQFVHLTRSLDEHRVVRLKRPGEADIGLRVLVSAINAGIARQSPQLQQGLPHHFGRALDDPAASYGKQRIAHERQFPRCKEIADVPGGMPRCLQDVRLQRTEFHTVALAPGCIDKGNAARFPEGCGDAAAMTLLECRDAPCVIRMMVRHQNIAQAPACALQGCLDGACFRRIDSGSGPGLVVVQENAVVVLKARKQVGLR